MRGQDGSGGSWDCELHGCMREEACGEAGGVGGDSRAVDREGRCCMGGEAGQFCMHVGPDGMGGEAGLVGIEEVGTEPSGAHEAAGSGGAHAGAAGST